MLGIAGMALIGGRMLAGFLLDRIHGPYVAAAFFLAPMAGIVLLSTLWHGAAAAGGSSSASA